ncbi:BcPIE4 [Botrytis cinerea T4]|uniref:BcPIE4 n=1 Tax=Botryotinia fuckeliana (strain T4) TaxID=999810 RepID=G2XXF3_BOTF4|nr:BcPIE4 [Botrytis cinerea T4]
MEPNSDIQSALAIMVETHSPDTRGASLTFHFSRFINDSS